MGRTRDVVASRVFEAVAHLASHEKQKDHAFTYTHTLARPSELRERTVMGFTQRVYDDEHNFHRRLITVMGET